MNEYLVNTFYGRKHKLRTKVDIYDMDSGTSINYPMTRTIELPKSQSKAFSYSDWTDLYMKRISVMHRDSNIYIFANPTRQYLYMDAKPEATQYTQPEVGLAYVFSTDYGLTWSESYYILPSFIKSPLNIKAVTDGQKIYVYYGVNDNVDTLPEEEDPNLKSIRCKVLTKDITTGLLTQESEFVVMVGSCIFTAYNWSGAESNTTFLALSENQTEILMFDMDYTNNKAIPRKKLYPINDAMHIMATLKDNVTYIGYSGKDYSTNTGGFTQIIKYDPVAGDFEEVGRSPLLGSDFIYEEGYDVFMVVGNNSSGPVSRYSISKSYDDCEHFTENFVMPAYGATDTVQSVGYTTQFIRNWEGNTDVIWVNNDYKGEIQQPTYERRYRNGETLIATIPDEKIKGISGDFIIGNGTSRACTIELTNTGNFFDDTGMAMPGGIPFKDILFGSYHTYRIDDFRGLSPRKVVVSINDDYAEGNMGYEPIFTGILVKRKRKSSTQSITLECQDMLWMAQTANIGDKIEYSGQSVVSIAQDMFSKSGLNNYSIEDSNRQIKYCGFERSNTVLDIILELAQQATQKVYCDRFGTIHMRNIDIEDNAQIVPQFILDESNTFDLEIDGPDYDQARNMVSVVVGTDYWGNPIEATRVMVDAVEAMNRYSLMVLDFTQYFERNSKSQELAIQNRQNAETLADYYVRKYARTTEYYYAKTKPFFHLEPYDIGRVVSKNPKCDKYARVLRIGYAITFGANAGYDFSIDLIDV